MRVRRLTIQNFRGISSGVVDFARDTLLVGGNNAGKSTVCEALDLVLGPERLYHRPVINEHDFYKGRYLDDEGAPVEIRIEALLLDISEEAERRFHNHLRRWNDTKGCFADEEGAGPEAGDADGTCWALPVVFIGRYDEIEDDFVGNTFLAHPLNAVEIEDDEETRIGAGFRVFTRDHKRLCGFLYLRTLRTGSRALSLQRGSLLDTTLRIGGTGLEKMWQDTLERLQNLDPPIGEIDQLKKIRSEVEKRMSQFVGLAPAGEATAFFASDMTRENLREVVRFFVASEQSGHLLPFQRLGSGAINILVFALLTFIAELKEKQSVIFAMEEPEIALPPHTQRRVVRFSLREMGQTIVTSHSPYVIEQFEPEQIVMLNRGGDGTLSGKPIDTQGIRMKTFKTERKQFAEAVLSRAVLVVEGSTEAAIFSQASTVMEKARGSEKYTHFDLAGVTVFNAGGDGSVPRYGPVFMALNKQIFGFFDKLSSPLSGDATTKLASYTKYWESPHKGIENLLVEEMSVATLRRFLEKVGARPDYPLHHPHLADTMNDAEVKDLAHRLLKDRKGDAYGYGALLIAESTTEHELPNTIRTILDEINERLAPPAKKDGPAEDTQSAAAVAAENTTGPVSASEGMAIAAEP
ncbi:MAG: AAA family ATPase [Candidatus Tectomicrobia bacterium]|nr:AAA family ATPase [Candidatus Tectomicrobia bacterium]